MRISGYRPSASWWLPGLLVSLLASGCKDTDREQLRQVGHKSVEKLQSLAGGPHGKVATALEAIRAAVSDRTLDSRVATRLRWDKNLTGATIRVKLVKPGVVQLTGFVSSADDKPKAVQIAHSTVGVEQVIDNLAIAPPPPAKPEEKN